MIIHIDKGYIMKIKLLAMIAACILSSAAMTGCSAVIEQEPEEVLIPEYTVDTLPDGIFVKSGDIFYQPSNENKTFTNLPENTSADRVIWYTDDKIHVPEYKNGDQIVYKNQKTIPSQFVLEGFEHVCDSVGIKGIRLNDAGNYVISGETSLHPTSDAYAKISPYLNTGTIVIDSIDGETLQSNMINKTGSINGLTKGQTCTLGIYIGTQYYEVEVAVDTEIYVSKSINTIAKYELTKNGYLVWKMPDLLTPGLYDLNGSGIVNYGGVIKGTE